MLRAGGLCTRACAGRGGRARHALQPLVRKGELSNDHAFQVELEKLQKAASTSSIWRNQSGGSEAAWVNTLEVLLCVD